MTTNIDRAAEHMDSLARLYDYASGHEPSNAERAQALADAGLLAPDLPEPSVWVKNEGIDPTAGWRGGHLPVTAYRTYAPVVFIGADTYMPPAEARALGLALLAAADYAERNHHE